MIEQLFDGALLFGMTLRLSRLVTTDYIGEWWLRDPAEKWADKHKRFSHSQGNVDLYEKGWRGKLVTGLECPFCIGFWLGIAGLISLELAGGLGGAHEIWRYTAGAFTLNYIVGHISARAD
jgi:hypothetical protein